ncbi:cyclic nucleotide-binding domain-containing protein [Elusimicrobiota bacterium]
MIGSLIGISVKPKAVVTSAFMAFGAGALLFSLTIEIVAHSFELAGFWPLAAGCIIGGLLYELLNHKLNILGAFFRKGSTAIRQITKQKLIRAKQMLTRLSRVKLLSLLPPNEFAAIAPHIEEIMYEKNTKIYEEGAEADALYIIETGKVAVLKGKIKIAELGADNVFGEMSMLTGKARSASMVALEKTKLFRISRKIFEELIVTSPKISRSLNDLVNKRSDDLVDKSVISLEVSNEWKKTAMLHLKSPDFRPTTHDINKAAHAHGSAAMGIWLGILLDGIPESLVIGILLTEKTSVPWALIAGVFLANLPEAMSSSVAMKTQNYKKTKILFMWGSIVLMTAVGALIGNLFFQGLSLSLISLIEGIAAGAMLTMIAETMLPEAYEQGGAVVGLSTLAGFLAALFIKYIS